MEKIKRENIINLARQIEKEKNIAIGELLKLKKELLSFRLLVNASLDEYQVQMTKSLQDLRESLNLKQKK